MFVYISSELESCSMAASETYSMMSPYMAHVDLAPNKVCVHSIINYRRGCAPISTPLDSMQDRSNSCFIKARRRYYQSSSYSYYITVFVLKYGEE
jgi:hypothetical protein